MYIIFLLVLVQTIHVFAEDEKLILTQPFYLKIDKDKYQVGTYKSLPPLTKKELEKYMKSYHPEALLLKGIYIPNSDLPGKGIGHWPTIFDSHKNRHNHLSWNSTDRYPPLTWKTEEIILKLSLLDVGNDTKYLVGIYPYPCLPPVFYAFSGVYLEKDKKKDLDVVSARKTKTVFVDIPPIYVKTLKNIHANFRLKKKITDKILLETLKKYKTHVDNSKTFPLKAEVIRIQSYELKKNNVDDFKFIKNYSKKIKKQNSTAFFSYDIVNKNGLPQNNVQCTISASSLPYVWTKKNNIVFNKINGHILLQTKNVKNMRAYFETDMLTELDQEIIKEEKINGIPFTQTKVVIGEFDSEPDLPELCELFLNLSIDENGKGKIWGNIEKKKLDIELDDDKKGVRWNAEKLKEQSINNIYKDKIPDNSIYITLPKNPDGSIKYAKRTDEFGNRYPEYVSLCTNIVNGGFIAVDKKTFLKQKNAPIDGYQKKVNIPPDVIYNVDKEFFFYFKLNNIYGRGRTGDLGRISFEFYSKPKVLKIHLSLEYNPARDRSLGGIEE